MTPDYYFSLATSLKSQNRLPEAVAAYQQALQLNPNFLEAHYNLGNTLRALNHLDEAADAFRRAIALRPDLAVAHNNLANVLRAQGKSAEAITAYQHALRLQPDNAEAHNNLASALAVDLANLPTALVHAHRAVDLRPTSPDFLTNLAKLHLTANNTDAASTALQQALALNPQHIEALATFIAHFLDQLEPAQALNLCHHALQLAPHRADLHYHLGLLHVRRHDYGTALASFTRALELDPQYAAAANNIGQCHKEMAQLDQALAAFKQAVALDPAFLHAESNYLYTLQFHEEFTPQRILDEHITWRRKYADPLKSKILPHANDRSAIEGGRKLRVGYVSPDFTTHCQSNFTLPLLSHHDRSRFHITLYADVKAPTAVTSRLQSLADTWRDTTALSDDQLADLIRADQIDLLVDLTMHMANNRLLVFARKPAPIQITWLAYPGTTGLDTLDYRLSDPFIDSPGPPSMFDAFYAEKTLRLPDTFWCYDPLLDPVLPINNLPALSNHHVTFGCLNNYCKVNDTLLTLWARILSQLPHSRLHLLAGEGPHRAHAHRIFAQHNVSPERVLFHPHQPRDAYFALYHQLDLCLDTAPYNGHTTSLDAFFMGLPVLTLLGPTVVGRAGLCQLHHLALEDWIAPTPDDYLAKALAFAQNLPLLQSLRTTLRPRLQASPLMNAQRFAHNIEAAYLTAWDSNVTRPS